MEILDEDFEVVGALTSGESVLRELRAAAPEVIVLDISLGDLTGFEVVDRLRAMGCTAPVVFLTVHEGIDFMRAAARLGASGYVYKSQAASELCKAVLAVARGEECFPAGYS